MGVKDGGGGTLGEWSIERGRCRGKMVEREGEVQWENGRQRGAEGRWLKERGRY